MEYYIIRIYKNKKKKKNQHEAEGTSSGQIK